MSQLSLLVTLENSDDIHTISVRASDTVAHAIAVVATALNANPNELTLLRDGVVLSRSATLASANVTESDVLLVRRQQQQQQNTSGNNNDMVTQLTNALSAGLRQQQQQPNAQLNAQAERFRQEVMHDRRIMSEIQERDPSLALAIVTGDLTVIGRFLRARHEAETARRLELERLHADPFNVDNQRRIEELIRSEQVHANYEDAMEHNPAAFAQVSMLYIDVKVNNVPVKAFVDSGAQMTIMSPDMARRCNLGHLIDTRFQGMAVGVGSQRILGRVHMLPLTIAGESYSCMVTVLERDNMDFLLGLDMLKAHRAIIDLKENVLRIGTVTTPFLGEAEIPRGSIGGKDMATEPNHPSSSSSTTTAQPPASSPARPPTSSAIPPTTQRTQQTSTSGGASEAHIATLIGLGATREEAIQLLRAANNNVDVAAGMLF